MNYTKGPWFIHDNTRTDFIPIGPKSSNQDYIVAGVVPLELYGHKQIINISDAKLVAAAPALLGWLKELITGINDEYKSSHPLNKKAFNAKKFIEENL